MAKRLGRILLAAVFMLLVFLSFYPVEDPDFWTHLCAGRWIVEQGRLPFEYPFLSTAPSGRWLPDHWLFQVVMYLFYRYGGFLALFILKSFLLCGAFYFLLRPQYRRERPAVAAIVLSLAVLCAVPRFNLLPELASLFFFSIFLGVLSRREKLTARTLILLAVIQVLWVNMHLYFFLGILLMGLFFLERLVEEKGAKGPARSLLIGLILVSAVSVINPQGLAGLVLPFTMRAKLQSIRFLNSITELQPTYTLPFTALFAYLSLACAGLVSFSLNYKRFRPFSFLLFVIFLVASLFWRRNVGFFALVALPLTMDNLSGFLDGLATQRQRKRAFCFGGLFAAALLILSGYTIALPYVEGKRSFGAAFSYSAYPVGGVEYIRRMERSMNVFTNFESGGFFNWQLFPGKKAFIDSSVGTFGSDLFIDYMHLMDRSLGLDAFADRYGIHTFLVMHQEEDSRLLVQQLFGEKRWRLVYLDDTSVVFSDAGFALAPETTVVPGDVPALLRLAAFYEMVGEYPQALSFYEKAGRLKNGDSRIEYNLARMYFNLQRYGQARERLLSSIRLNGHFYGAFYLLGLVHAQAAEYPQAVRAFQRACQLNPRHPDSYYNLAVAQSMIAPVDLEAVQRALARAVQLGYVPAPGFPEHVESLKKNRK